MPEYEFWRYFFGLIPGEYYRLIGPLSLIILGLVIDKKAKETKYTGRLSMFSNSMALVSFYILIPTAPFLLKILVNVALVLGIIGIVSYSMDEHHLSHKNYYQYTKYFNSLVTGGLILGYYLFPNWF